MAQHCTEDDLWVCIDGKVFDVTSYVSTHPGGRDSLLSNTGGVDASEAFHGMGHSNYAKSLLDGMFIGNLVGSAKAAGERKGGAPMVVPSAGGIGIKVLQMTLPILLAVAAVLIKLGGDYVPALRAAVKAAA